MSDIPLGLTTSEERLVERYLWVCDYMGRVAQAIDGGNWHYLQDKAAEMERRVTALHEEALRVFRKESTVRPGHVLAGVRWFGRMGRVARLLHPLRLKPDLNEVRSIAMQVAGASGVTMSDEQLGRLAEATARIAQRTDVEPDVCVRVLVTLAAFVVRDDEDSGPPESPALVKPGLS
jgi:hypothetical protein